MLVKIMVIYYKEKYVIKPEYPVRDVVTAIVTSINTLTRKGSCQTPSTPPGIAMAAVRFVAATFTVPSTV